MKTAHALGLFASVLALALTAGCGDPSAPADNVRDIPRLSGVRIDGSDADWGGEGLKVEILTGQGAVDTADCRGRLRVGWTDEGLVVVARVRDNDNWEHPDSTALWQGDCVELFLRPRKGAKDCYQIVAAPGLSTGQPDPRHHVHDHRSTQALKAFAIEPRVARSAFDGGYVLEVLMPWEPLGIVPEPGREVGVQVYVNDRDGEGDKVRLMWHPRGESHREAEHYERVRLSEKASPPAVAAASGRYEHLSRVRLDVAAIERMAGREVVARTMSQELARGRLTAKGGIAVADLIAPMPEVGRSYGPVSVLVGGTRVATIALPDADETRAREFMGCGVSPAPAVFIGEEFPAIRFPRPLRAEAMIGRYTIETDWYDADLKRVLKAEKPGGYGAVIRITGQDGKVYTRYRTVYRAEGSTPWRDWKFAGAVELPPELGVDPGVCSEQSRWVNEMLKWSTATAMEHGDPLAVLATELARVEPGEGPMSVYDSPWARNRQWWVELKRKLNGNAERFPDPIRPPVAIPGKPARVLREGTAAEAGVEPDTAERLDALLTEWAENSGEPFIALVARRGVIVLHKAYGMRDGEPMTVDTGSWMASLTKLLQGTCLMMCVDQGRVDLNAPICKYLPEFTDAGVCPKITPRHLVTHTAGMWGHWGDDAHDLGHVIAEYGPYLEPCKEFSYNGMDLALCSKIIEQVSGECLPKFYQHHLVEPLGMKHTEVTNSSYDAKSTAYDMALVGQMLCNGGSYGNRMFIRPATLELMLPRNLSPLLKDAETEIEWGVGTEWMDNDILGPRTWGHGAASGATLRIDPDNELVVSMTRNTAGENFQEYHKRFLKLIAECMIDPTLGIPEDDGE